MKTIHGFELVRKKDIPEFKSRAELFKHIETGAELLSLSNKDENKAFGITFRTPAADSTGVSHILEHCVLSGSRKYPVKSPFAELLKGSLQSYMNAYTYADSTTYAAVSQNPRDFYNLIDVFLDAVFFPLLTPEIFHTEAWHYEWDPLEDSLSYKGVVLSEMHGCQATPDVLLSRYTRQSLFPDTPYRFNSGGEPAEIPNLTYQQLKDFHRRYYHPSNARIYFYGDDDPVERLRIINETLKDFQKLETDTTIALQPPFTQPRRLICSFPIGTTAKQTVKSMVTMSWVLGNASDWEQTLALFILEYLLIGMPASPLHKALLDSNYGESLAGEGLGDDLRQIFISIGLKGVEPVNTGKVEAHILETLGKLRRDGIPFATIEAAINHVEFTFRQQKTRPFPNCAQLFLRSLSSWLSDEDPLEPLSFEAPLAAIKSKIRKKEPLFEGMIDRLFLGNNHRLTLFMHPDPDLAGKNEAAAKERLALARAAMSKAELEEITATSKKLKELQETPDPPELLALIPRLSIQHLDRKNKVVPSAASKHKGMQILYHNLFTNGIVYVTIGFNMQLLPQDYLPYARLFARALLELGTETENYTHFTRRTICTTGGISPGFFVSSLKESKESASWLFLQGRAMNAQIDALLGIFKESLLRARLDHRERFRQILMGEKGKLERRIIPSGHQIIQFRLGAHFNKAGWAGEQMNGISYVLFLRGLIKKVDSDWPGVLHILEEMRRLLINRNAMLINITLDEAGVKNISSKVNAFINSLPAQPVGSCRWHPGTFPVKEGLVMPTQVNFVGKAANLYDSGYVFHGSAFVIARYLRTGWLWEQTRIQSGAYECYCYFDRLSGVFSLVSVRDPAITRTLKIFDQTARFLKNIDLNEDELTRSIIGAIGEMDRYKLPDQKGYTSMMRFLTSVTDAERQQIREEILGTTSQHFREFGDVLQAFTGSQVIKVLGSESAVRKAMPESIEFLKIF